MLSDNRINVEVVGIDYDVLMEYIRQQSPVFIGVDGRIHIDNACLVWWNDNYLKFINIFYLFYI